MKYYFESSIDLYTLEEQLYLKDLRRNAGTDAAGNFAVP